MFYHCKYLLYLRRVGEEFWELKSKMLHLPTILWFAGRFQNIKPTVNWSCTGEVSNHGKGGELDVFLDGIALTGAFLAILVMVRGAANMMVMAMMWILYMSIVNVGQNWFSFGWESQLLETGFLAIWAVPLFSFSRFPSHLPPPPPRPPKLTETIRAVAWWVVIVARVVTHLRWDTHKAICDTNTLRSVRF